MTIRTLTEGIYFDDRTPSFGIRIGKHRKTWLVIKGKNRTRIRLGHYPAMSLAAARRAALHALGNPLQASAAPTFHEARSEFLEQKHWKARTAREVERLLIKHFDWQKTLDKITPSDVVAAIDAIPPKAEASNALKYIKSFFNWCVPRYIPHTPCTGIKPPARYVPRERLLSMDELAAIWRAAEQVGQYGRQVQLLILTGQRCNQLLQPYSVSDGTLTFPPASMKNNRSHTIPLGKLTASLLGGTPVPFHSSKKAQLDRLSGVTGWTLHDIRRAFASGMASLGVGLPVIERLLAHRSGSFAGIVGVYQHYDFLPEARRAIDLWENHILKITAASP
jgi:integrase